MRCFFVAAAAGVRGLSRTFLYHIPPRNTEIHIIIIIIIIIMYYYIINVVVDAGGRVREGDDIV